VIPERAVTVLLSVLVVVLVAVVRNVLAISPLSQLDRFAAQAMRAINRTSSPALERNF